MPSETPQRGLVYLVGAGPGDPELITVKGRRCIASADVLIYDYLASPTLLAHARSDCESIYVGKKGGDHTLSQEGINDLIVAQARQGKIVTRLKGGDPFIFGRGGEEAEVLVAAGIPFEVVPGVSSAIAAPAYAGIPLTHRHFTSTVAFITGHEDPLKDSSSIDWPSLAKGIGTLVFLMGVKNLPQIVDRLIANGRPGSTQVAVVRWGTTPRQQTVVGTLNTIAEEVAQAGLKAPAIIVVGQVVQLRQTLEWFEKRPLLGKRVVVTRARAQASDLVQKLTDLGAQCLETPTIIVVPPQDRTPLERAIENLAGYDWLVFTSVNGVSAFFDCLFSRGLDSRALGHVRTACIGPATADRLRSYGLGTDILPRTYQAESVVEAFDHIDLKGKSVLLPRAQEARSVLPEELQRMGAKVDEVAAYQTLPVSHNAPQIQKQLQQQAVDMVTFTSSSTVHNFLSLIPSDQRTQLLTGVRIACIGPITADTVKSYGLKVDLTAETFTIEGLCKAMVDYYSQA
jgi:uroporphyrinogen III methyltransferase/synthase